MFYYEYTRNINTKNNSNKEITVVIFDRKRADM